MAWDMEPLRDNATDEVFNEGGDEKMRTHFRKTACEKEHFFKRSFSLCSAVLLLMLAIVANFPALAEATTWIVTSSADDGDRTTLRYAVESAMPGDTISIKVDTVYLTKFLFVNRNLKIIGPATLRQVTPGERVLYFASNITCLLSDLTITGGDLQGSSYCGAGLINYGDLTMKNCIVTNNTVGGGILNAGNLTMHECTVRNNTANWPRRAAGINNEASSYSTPLLTMYNCIVEKNENFDTAGGGILNGETLVMYACTVRNNKSKGMGGGLLLNSGTHTTLGGCVIQGNAPDQICSNGTLVSDGPNFIGNSPNESATAFAGYAGDAEPQPRSIADDPDVTAVENALADSGSDLFATVEAALSGDLNGTSGSVTAALAGITASLYYANTFEDVALEGDDLVVEYTASYPERARYYALFARADGSGYESPERGVQFEIRPGQDLPEGVTPPDFYEEGEGLMTWRNVVADGGPYDLNPDPGVVTFRVCSVRAAATGTPASGGCSVGAVGGTASTLPLTLLLGIPFLATRGDSRGRQQAPRCQSRRGH